jgi:hypothetical protein
LYNNRIKVEVEMVNEKLAAGIFGVTRTSRANCVCHDIPQAAASFSDEVSFREFSISGLCQKTQDEIFGEDEEE